MVTKTIRLGRVAHWLPSLLWFTAAAGIMFATVRASGRQDLDEQAAKIVAQQATAPVRAENIIPAPSPLRFPAPWVPDREQYHAGEVIRFRVTEITTEPNLSVIAYDQWVDADGLVYPGQLRGRQLTTAGRRSRRVAVILPERLPVGVYYLAGSDAVLGYGKSMAARYQSLPFRVAR